MQNKLLPWLCLVGLAFSLAWPTAAQTPTAPAANPTAAAALAPGNIRATRVVGTVRASNSATGETISVQNNTVLQQGFVVRTLEQSSVVLIFDNGASVNLAQDSELNIEQFLQSPFEGAYEPAKATDEPGVSVTNIKLMRGELVGNVKKLKQTQGSKFTVGTPVGAAGIRGTTFRIVYRPTGTGNAFNFVLTTVEGNVELAVGTVQSPVAVTDNREVVINNVTVDPTTNQVTVTTSTGATVSLTTAPVVGDAPVTTIQAVAQNANQLSQALVDVVITAPTPPPPPPPPPAPTTPPPPSEPAPPPPPAPAPPPPPAPAPPPPTPAPVPPAPISPPPPTGPRLPGTPGNTTPPGQVTPAG